LLDDRNHRPARGGLRRLAVGLRESRRRGPDRQDGEARSKKA
jgi:hypothetical protein